MRTAIIVRLISLHLFVMSSIKSQLQFCNITNTMSSAQVIALIVYTHWKMQVEVARTGVRGWAENARAPALFPWNCCCASAVPRARGPKRHFAMPLRGSAAQRGPGLFHDLGDDLPDRRLDLGVRERALLRLQSQRNRDGLHAIGDAGAAIDVEHVGLGDKRAIRRQRRLDDLARRDASGTTNARSRCSGMNSERSSFAFARVGRCLGAGSAVEQNFERHKRRFGVERLERLRMQFAEPADFQLGAELQRRASGQDAGSPGRPARFAPRRWRRRALQAGPARRAWRHRDRPRRRRPSAGRSRWPWPCRAGPRPPPGAGRPRRRPRKSVRPRTGRHRRSRAARCARRRRRGRGSGLAACPRDRRRSGWRAEAPRRRRRTLRLCHGR